MKKLIEMNKANSLLRSLSKSQQNCGVLSYSLQHASLRIKKLYHRKAVGFSTQFFNKRGFIASYMVDFYAYLVFAVILIVFFVSIAAFGSNIDASLSNEVASADVTARLIKVLQEKDSSGLTVAEIISKGVAPSVEFKSVVSNAIKTVLPSKKGVSDAWLRVYVSGEPKRNFCGMPLNSFLNNVWDLGLGDLNPDSKSKVFGFVNVPLVSGDDFVFVVLCVHRGWFDE